MRRPVALPDSVNETRDGRRAFPRTLFDMDNLPLADSKHAPPLGLSEGKGYAGGFEVIRGHRASSLLS